MEFPAPSLLFSIWAGKGLKHIDSINPTNFKVLKFFLLQTTVWPFSALTQSRDNPAEPRKTERSKCCFHLPVSFTPNLELLPRHSCFVFSLICVDHIPPTQKVAGEEHSDSVCILFQWWGPRHAFTTHQFNTASKTSRQAKKNIPLDNWDHAPLRYHCTRVDALPRPWLRASTRETSSILPAELNTFDLHPGGWHSQHVSRCGGLLEGH